MTLPTVFLAEPCPFCELHMLYRMPGFGGESPPLACANPACDSNHPPAREPGACEICGAPAACPNPDCDSNNPRP